MSLSPMDRRRHWEQVYGTRPPQEVSWFQPHAALSLRLIRKAVPDRRAPIVDVGGGASTLVDGLVEAGYRRVSVLDLSRAALDHARRRLGPRAGAAGWVVADVLQAPLASGSLALWHDRAVFHFITDPVDRDRYAREVRRVIRPGGLVLVATFAPDGPERCSGLPVARYTPTALHAVFGGGFDLVTALREIHHTPSGAPQPFTWCLCRRRPGIQDGASV